MKFIGLAVVVVALCLGVSKFDAAGSFKAASGAALIFLPLPLLVLGLRDVLKRPLSKWFSSQQLLLHLAAFVPTVLIFVGILVQSGFEASNLTRVIPLLIVFPLIVYAVPLMLAIRGFITFPEAKALYRLRRDRNT